MNNEKNFEPDSKKKLLETIYNIIKKEVSNVKLLKNLFEYFSDNKINTNIVDRVFKEELELEELETHEIICLAEGLREHSQFSTPDLFYKKYYTKPITDAYDNKEYIVEEKVVEELELDVTYVGNGMFSHVFTAGELSMIRKNRLTKYDKNIQRETTLVKMRNGRTRRIMTLNKKGVAKLSRRVRDNAIFPTAITFATIKYKGKTPNFRYVGENKINTIGKLYIKPCYDLDSENYAPLCRIDGNHRFMAYCNAYDDALRKGNKIDRVLQGFIFLMDEPQAKQYVADSFERNDMSDEWRYALQSTEEKKVADELIQKCKWLENNTVNTITDYINNKNVLFSRDEIALMIEASDIDLTNQWRVAEEIDRMSKGFELLFSFMFNEKFKEKTPAEIRKDTNLFDLHMGGVYFAIIHHLQEYSTITIMNVVEKIIELNNSGELKKLKVNHKQTSLKSLANKIIELIEV